jgi:N-carbamoyl-L-amino-acid hydrolase
MALRQDAFMGAAEFALDLEAAAWERAAETAAVGTVGKVGVSPNGTNVVPGEVELGVDIRDTDEESRQRLVETAKRRGREIADKRDVKFDWEDLLDVSAIPMADGVVETLDDACEAVGIDANRMPSGAGHDAMNVATVTPTGMLFVPSEGGVSHNPSEYTAPEDLAAGARVLERGLRSLAEV